MQNILMAHSVRHFAPAGTRSDSLALTALRIVHPGIVFKLYGAGIEPRGIICRGLRLNFPFLDVMLHEIAAGVHEEAGSYYGSRDELLLVIH